MLARTTLRDRALSAAELGISEEEREALLWFHERKRIVHNYEDKNMKGLTFNMETVYSKHKCGTVGCIAGWVAFKLDRNAENYYRCCVTGTLDKLYYPSPENKNWNQFSPAQAKLAVELWLCGNRDPWPEALELLP